MSFLILLLTIILFIIYDYKKGMLLEDKLIPFLLGLLVTELVSPFVALAQAIVVLLVGIVLALVFNKED